MKYYFRQMIRIKYIYTTIIYILGCQGTDGGRSTIYIGVATSARLLRCTKHFSSDKHVKYSKLVIISSSYIIYIEC